MNTFKTYHPITNIIYFALALGFGMFFMHPVALAASFCGAFIYSVILNGSKAVKFNLAYMLPMLIFTALLNPMFNHEGSTILAYYPNGNPLTLESIIYGGAAAVMLGAAVCWFSCFNAVMTSDKLIYLTGRILPSLSLIISMSLRFVPYLKRKAVLISQARIGMGTYPSKKRFSKLRHGIKVLSILIGSSLEESVQTADSMKCRGFGLKGRTSYSRYTFTARDKIFLAAAIALSSYVIAGALSGAMYISYFPDIFFKSAGIYEISVFTAYWALCILPSLLHFGEVISWKYIQSKI